MDQPNAAQDAQLEAAEISHFVFDFDGTITTNDTIDLVVQAALQWQRETSNEDTTRHLSESWQRIQDAYDQDLRDYESSQPPKARRTTIEAEISYLRGRREMEAKSLQRVIESGLFHGLDVGRLFQAGVQDREAGRVLLRDGIEVYLRTLKDKIPGCMIHILSVNWSASYIKGVLSPMDDFVSGFISNEIQYDGTISAVPGALPEPEPRALTTSEDKLRAFQHLLDKHGGHLLYYFGDSTTDLECLLASGTGVILTPDGAGSLVETLQRIQGRPVPHNDSQERIVWMKDFTAAQLVGTSSQ